MQIFERDIPKHILMCTTECIFISGSRTNNQIYKKISDISCIGSDLSIKVINPTSKGNLRKLITSRTCIVFNISQQLPLLEETFGSFERVMDLRVMTNILMDKKFQTLEELLTYLQCTNGYIAYCFLLEEINKQELQKEYKKFEHLLQKSLILERAGFTPTNIINHR